MADAGGSTCKRWPQGAVRRFESDRAGASPLEALVTRCRHARVIERKERGAARRMPVELHLIPNVPVRVRVAARPWLNGRAWRNVSPPLSASGVFARVDGIEGVARRMPVELHLSNAEVPGSNPGGLQKP